MYIMVTNRESLYTLANNDLMDFTRSRLDRPIKVLRQIKS